MKKKLEPYIAKPDDLIEVYPPSEEPKEIPETNIWIPPKAPLKDDEGNQLDPLEELESDHTWLDYKTGEFLKRPEQRLEEKEQREEQTNWPDLKGDFLSQLRMILPKEFVIKFLLAFSGKRIWVPTQETIWKEYRNEEIITVLKKDESFETRDHIERRYENMSKEKISHLYQKGIDEKTKKQQKLIRERTKGQHHRTNWEEKKIKKLFVDLKKEDAEIDKETQHKIRNK